MNEYPKPRHAFGVDPHRPEFYSLRQARYEAMAQDISDWAGKAARSGRKLSVLDVGCSNGTLARYLEVKPDFDAIELSGTEFVDRGLYKPELYREFFMGDLTAGHPEVPSDAYDVVVCEQVLEHLEQLDVAIATLERVLKPGGRLIVGVPIFLPPFPFFRNCVLKISRTINPEKRWSHLQTFSYWSFLRRMRSVTSLRLLRTRGFRIISGGMLRGLENHRLWWEFNCKLGRLMPAACIEFQATMEKPAAVASP